MTLDKYTLHKDQKSDRWRLEKEGSNRAKELSIPKKDALKKLRGAVGPHGGSVRIRKVDNTIQGELNVSALEGPQEKSRLNPRYCLLGDPRKPSRRTGRSFPPPPPTIP